MSRSSLPGRPAEEPIAITTLRTLPRGGPPQLPAPMTSMIGREQEIAGIRALLAREDVRLLTLTGPGGAGKTRLALHAAFALEAEFADGARFVDLAPVRDPALVAPAIVQALGVHHAGTLSATEVLKAFLCERETLLLLDNFEQVVEAGPQVAELLRSCPGLVVMVTSRSALNLLGEHVRPVPPLALPRLERLPPVEELARVGSIRLFLERAQAANAAVVLSDENAEAIAAICHRLDGLPLAIELAAARSVLFSPRALLARLDHRLPQLTGGPRDQPARLQTMHNAVAWSHDLLGAEERAVFRGLAVFVGGCTLEAAEAVVGSRPGNGGHAFDVASVIESLARQSLVRAVPGPDGGTFRIEMLETIREYARDRLVAADEIASVRRRHAEFFVGFAEDGTSHMRGPAESEWIDRLDADRENFRAALAWADEHGEADVGLRLITALHIVWYSHGRVTEARRWLDRLLASPRVDTVPPVTRAAALTAASWFAVIQADFPRAAAYSEEAVHLARRARQPTPLARALLILGVAYQHLDLERARAYTEEAVALLRGLDDPAWMAIAVGELGVVMRWLGDFPAATALFKEQVAIERVRGYARGVARATVDLGDLARDRGDARAATAHYRQALVGFRASGDLTYTSICLTWVCLMATDLSPRTMARLLGTADVLCERIGLPGRSSDEERYHHVVARVRADLGEEAFAAAWSAGRALSLDEAIEAALAADADTPATGPAPLTLRERAILPLLVDGKTDREIAEALFLSRRTVEGHVGRLLAKLGVPTRTAAASAAMAAGLLAPVGAPRRDETP